VFEVSAESILACIIHQEIWLWITPTAVGVGNGGGNVHVYVEQTTPKRRGAVHRQNSQGLTIR